MVQEILTYIIVFLAVFYAIFSIIKMILPKRKISNTDFNCNSVCSGCSLASACKKI